jgi:muconolactone D-isomerase
MLYHVTMEVRLPPDLDPAAAERLKADEKAMALQLQRDGKWLHLWRIVGRYANVSIFDVDSHDELHTILSGLPLFPFMDLEVTALARHPSALTQEVTGMPGKDDSVLSGALGSAG